MEKQIWTTLLILTCIFIILLLAFSLFTLLRQLRSINHQIMEKRKIRVSLSNRHIEELAALINEKDAQHKALQIQIMQEEERLKQSVSNISHDLRTPLTSISGNSGMLMQQGDNLSADQKQKLYEDIYDDSVWLYNLVENLLSVTKIENGSMELKQQPELLEDVISEALSHIRRRLRGHKIQVHLEDEFLMAWMDAKLIMQVIMNIVDNAIKYTPEDSHIDISAKKLGDRIYINIADDGQGIPDDRKEKVFDLFYTGEYQAADGTRSMGVGLSLCRSIVEAHGGKLEVRDNVPKGTCFLFDLKAEDVGGDNFPETAGKA